MVLMFIPYVSTAFVPAHTMPAVLGDFARYQPFTPIIETMRGLWMGHTSTGVAVSHEAWIAIGLLLRHTGPVVRRGLVALPAPEHRVTGQGQLQTVRPAEDTGVDGFGDNCGSESRGSNRDAQDHRESAGWKEADVPAWCVTMCDRIRVEGIHILNSDRTGATGERLAAPTPLSGSGRTW